MSASATPPPPMTGATLWLAAFVLSLTNFMVVLDATIANVSVPHIAGGLAVSPAQGTWVITSYSVAEAITVPLTGWLAQRFGPVKLFVAGMAGFGLFSMLCGLAPTFSLLVLFRVLQGLCGGPMMPMSQTLMLQIFPKERRAQAMAIWSMTIVTAPILGPILGGVISDGIGWSWIFFINIPVALGVSLVAWNMLRSHESPTRRVPVDYTGLGLLVLWVGSLQIMLDRGKELDWFASPLIVCLGLLALIGFAAFLIWELTAENPIVNLRVFRHRGFVVGVITLSLTFGAYFASIVLLPLWLQTTMGYTASFAGYAMALNGVFAVVLSPFVARLLGRIDSRLLITFGVLGMAFVSYWRGHYSTELNYWAIAMPQLVMGLFVPFFFMVSTNLTLSSVRPEETAAAAGLSNFLRTSGAAFATSIMTTLWESSAVAKRANLAAGLNDVPGTMSRLMSHGLTQEQALGQMDHLVQNQAVMLATNRMFLMASVVFIIAASTIWLAPKPRPPGGPPMGGH